MAAVLVQRIPIKMHVHNRPASLAIKGQIRAMEVVVPLAHIMENPRVLRASSDTILIRRSRPPSLQVSTILRSMACMDASPVAQALSPLSLELLPVHHAVQGSIKVKRVSLSVLYVHPVPMLQPQVALNAQIALQASTRAFLGALYALLAPLVRCFLST
jgi:hypothetical protein